MKFYRRLCHVIYHDGRDEYLVAVDSARAHDLVSVICDLHVVAGPRATAREFRQRAQAAAVVKANHLFAGGWRVLTVCVLEP